ncbi:MAG: TorD/DmsD family molecular chaperone [Rhodospirillales bacterium]
MPPLQGAKPGDLSPCSHEDFGRVCNLYNRQFELTSHTPCPHNTHSPYTKAFSGAYFRDGQPSDAAAAAEKSGRTERRGRWVRERRVLATATAVDIAEEDRARAQVYGLLGAALTRPPSAEFLKRLGAIEGDASPLGQGFAALAAAARATAPGAAEEEFNALFVGMPQGEMTPYASYYMTGFLYEKPLARLRADMARLGLSAAQGVPEPEDHAGMLCEMMAALIEGRFASPLDLAEQRKFFEAHLAPWAGRFFADLAAAKAARLYMPVGAIGRIFMDVESEAFARA